MISSGRWKRFKSRPFTARLRIFWESDMALEEKRIIKFGLWRWQPISSGKVKDRFFYGYYD